MSIEAPYFQCEKVLSCAYNETGNCIIADVTQEVIDLSFEIPISKYEWYFRLSPLLRHTEAFCTNPEAVDTVLESNRPIFKKSHDLL